MTKPYLSSSHYLLKMSDYPAGPWGEIWDGLFWRFIKKHQTYFAAHPRLKPLIGHLNRMPSTKRHRLIRDGEEFLEKLHGQRD